LDEVNQPTKFTVTGAIRWIVGIFFIIVVIGFLMEGYFASAFFVLLIAMILIPPIATAIETKFNFTLSGPLRIVLVVVLLVGMGIVTPANTSSHAAASTSATTSTPTTISTPTTTPTIYKIGDRVVVGGRAYTVNSVRTASTVGDQYSNAKANGIFVIVDLTIETLEKESTQMSSNDIKIVDSQGRTFDYSIDGSVQMKDDLFLKQLQPGLPAHGETVFDVPKGITANLQVSEGGFGDKTELISLGTIQ
jgi:hypothetical protein